jgi:hypothetical protein
MSFILARSEVKDPSGALLGYVLTVKEGKGRYVSALFNAGEQAAVCSVDAQTREWAINLHRGMVKGFGENTRVRVS